MYMYKHKYLDSFSFPPYPMLCGEKRKRGGKWGNAKDRGEGGRERKSERGREKVRKQETERD